MPGRGGGNGSQRIAQERVRQRTVKGYDAAHDSEHGHADDLVLAAACYLIPAKRRQTDPAGVPLQWPWEDESWKPTPDDRIRELEKAGALVAAAIDAMLA